MNPALLIGVLTPLAAILGAVLSYLVTTQRNTTVGEVERGRLELDDARAALEAWAEYATTVRDDVMTSRHRIAGLELMVENLRVELSDCLRSNRG